MQIMFNLILLFDLVRGPTPSYLYFCLLFFGGGVNKHCFTVPAPVPLIAILCSKPKQTLGRGKNKAEKEENEGISYFYPFHSIRIFSMSQLIW